MGTSPNTRSSLRLVMFVTLVLTLTSSSLSLVLWAQVIRSIWTLKPNNSNVDPLTNSNSKPLISVIRETSELVTTTRVSVLVGSWTTLLFLVSALVILGPSHATNGSTRLKETVLSSVNSVLLNN